jgi:diaminohydroxyphosphoribosylaminopyrimidine deaminase/5-amino-6-(5-phosphoribosylamino)uracil reductase
MEEKCGLISEVVIPGRPQCGIQKYNVGMKQYERIEDYYMARCLALAERGRGNVSPNPMVGAVVLDAMGKKVGEGYHEKLGGPHAEVVALNNAGDAARGGTLYVNLEPCNHTGRTPPCTEKIIQSGIERVICGTLDPNPLVSGAGRDTLQNSRISVRYGFLEEACRKLNEVFFYYITTNRPFVTLKLAMTLDGKIATRSGRSQWLTGAFSRQYVHHLRSGNDAIMTTAETVLADNCRLTVRDIPGVTHQPVRVVLDSAFRLDPRKFKIFETSMAPTWVVVSRIRHNEEHADLARERGVEVIEVDETGLGLDLREVLEKLGQRQISSVFVEAGGRLAGSLMNQNLVNKLFLFYAPQLMSDPSAKPGFTGSISLDLPGTPRLMIANTRKLERDLVVEAYPAQSEHRTTIKPAVQPVFDV